MAVTEILGTDSLSSSRVTLNNNFLDVQDEIQDLQALLDPSTNKLTVNEITTGNITINATMGSGIATLLETTTTSLEVDGETNLKQLIKKTGIEGSIGTPTTGLPATLAHSTYFVDLGTTLSLSNVVATDGTEITLISATDDAGYDPLNPTTSATANIDVAGIKGPSSIAMYKKGSTLTLRYIDNFWYIIGSYGCVIGD